MEIILFFTTVTFLLSSAILYFKLSSKNHLSENLLSEKIIFEQQTKNLQEHLQTQNKKLQFLEEQNSDLTIYKGKFSQSEIIISDLKAQNLHLKQELESLNQKLSDYNKNNELLKQKQEILINEQKEWHLQKETLLHKLSEELIRKNSDQQVKFSNDQKENIKKITEDLLKNFENVLGKVQSLDDDMKKTSAEVSLTKNALLNPGGAGRTAEITLENILKSSGLREKINNHDEGDFILQSHFSASDQSGKRPDAVVFLPGNRILIIDSKSSSHFLELQKNIENDNKEAKKELESKIKEMMRKHLEDLKRKDYAKSKLEEIGFGNFFNSDQVNIMTVMFLQTEKMLEIVNNLDGEIQSKALNSNIFILSPIGLINLLDQAKFTIDRIRQDENISQLKIEIKKIVESVAMLFERASEVGETIRKSSKSYDKFIASFNGRFLPRIKNISKFGIEVNEKNFLKKLQKIEDDGELLTINATENEEG